MINVKISQKHDNVHCIRKNYTLKYVYNDESERINDTLSHNNYLVVLYGNEIASKGCNNELTIVVHMSHE